ncbi:MAG: bifunctional phosphopantothenoylcysteine decarboxylase/phosphopantothenate--cysteine ligase CoaBC [Asticcacaulis sp.]
MGRLLKPLNQPHRVLLIISGGIAAYKSLELIRLLRKDGIVVRCVLTRAAEQFVTPLSVAALSGEKIYQDLFDLTDETEMGHISLSRWADVILVAPATAHVMARAAQGLADDLATTLLLATDAPILMAPAMNVRMWDHTATVRNRTLLKADGVTFIGPDSGDMACGEYGPGRLAEPEEIVAGVQAFLASQSQQGILTGRHILVTAGPTFEPLDPVRGLTNRSSGKQGYLIAGALADHGARVTLVSGPTALATPSGVTRVDVETALEMQAAVTAALPADVAICVAAVADWRPVTLAADKLKKTDPSAEAVIRLTENPDILAGLAQHPDLRPRLVIGFAAETTDVEAHARAKLLRKGCDALIANNVREGVFGTDQNRVALVTKEALSWWPATTKAAIARSLAEYVVEVLNAQS